MAERWTAFLLRRPVGVFMIAGALAVAGLVALSRIPLNLMPAVDHPLLTVETAWPGMPAEMVEMTVTAPIEEAAGTVPGVRKVSSVSSEGLSRISIGFAEGTRMRFARLDLKEKLAALHEMFPPGTGEPVCEAYVPEEFRSLQGFMSYSLAGPGSGAALRTLAAEHVAPRLRAVRGVAGVTLYGGEEEEVLISLNPDALLSLGLGPDEVDAAIAGMDANASAGAVEHGSFRRVVSVRSQALRLDDLKRTEVGRTENGHAVRLGDVGTVRLAAAEPASLFRIDGVPAVTLVVHKAPQEDALRVAGAVRAAVAGLDATLPSGVRMKLESDTSREIRDELALLSRDVVLAILAVLVVLTLFFNQLRAPLVVVSSVLVSLAGTVLVFRVCGIGLHLLTLAGLVLGLGRLVDDAIVVLDHIRGEGSVAERPGAIPRSVAEIALPVIASTLATIGALAPVALLPADLKPYFLEFAFAVGVSLLMSLCASFTLIPVAASRFAMPATGSARFAAVGQSGRRAYAWLMRRALERTPAVALAACILLAGSAWLFGKTGTGEVWDFGRDTYLLVRIAFPQGTDLRRCDAVARQVEAIAADYRHALAQTTCRVEGGIAFLRIAVAEDHAGSAVPAMVKERLTMFAARTGGATVDVWGYGPGFSGSGQNLPSFAIRVLGFNYVRVREIAEELRARLRHHPRVGTVEIDRSWTGTWERATELVAQVNTEVADRHGLSAGDVVRAVGHLAPGARPRRRIMVEGEVVPYTVSVAGHRDFSVDDLRRAVIRGPHGNALRIAEFLTLEERSTPGEIQRENQSYVRWVTCEYRGPHRLGEALVDATIRSMTLPHGYRIDRPLAWLSLPESRRRSFLAVAAAAVLMVFMVTASLYESFSKPFVVILTVPFSLVGLFLAFALAGVPFGRGGYAAILLLVGIVAGNGIVLVDGLSRACAKEGASAAVVVAAASRRLRPVLMTTLTTIAGLLPMLVLGDRSGIWHGLALGTIGGLLSSMVLTLVLVPAAYLCVEGMRAGRQPKSHGPAGQTS